MRRWGYLAAGVVLLWLLMRETASSTTQRIAQAIAYAEGFYRGDGSLNGNAKPVRYNNPGDLSDATGIRQFATLEEGWNALYRQIDLILSGSSRVYDADMTIAEMAALYTADGPVASAAWARTVAGKLGVSPNTKLSEVA